MAVACGGCESGSLKKAEESDSILAIFSGPTPADAVEAMVDPHDPDRRLRGTALVAFAPFGGEELYVKYYVNQIQTDEDPGVRAVAARALSFHGSPEHAPLIVPLLDNPDRNVRLEAARALQRIHNPAAIEELIKHTRPERFVDTTRVDLVGTRVGESEAMVRAECCTALGQYAEPRVLQALIGALDDQQLSVTRAASASLSTLTGQEFGEDQRRWLTWLAGNNDPFSERREYLYPAFSRDRKWVEYIPLVPPPPNETPAPPAGMGSLSIKTENIK
ncbi:MAG: HEAT repeat domain-containing protein [Phycisphaerales bacterium]